MTYIACPKCDWRPDGSDHWQCTCLHVWNTFSTHGVCPACGKVWKETQCLICYQWSDHEDWYHEDNEETVEEFLKKRSPIVIEPTPQGTLEKREAQQP